MKTLFEHIIRQVLKEYSYDHEYYNYLTDTCSPYSIVSEFMNDRNGKIYWPLIPAAPYQKALKEFMKNGSFMHFPTKYIYEWMEIIMHNTAMLRSITEIGGHSQYYPSDEIIDALGLDEDDSEYDYESLSEKVDELGFWDWVRRGTPHGAYEISDYGVEPLEEIISEYNENLTPEEVIVLVNRALDIYHGQGPLAYNFIEGGTKTLSQISENKMNRKIVISENQLKNLLKKCKKNAFLT